MGKFCGKCGSPIDQTTGLCSNCAQQGKDPEKKTMEKYIVRNGTEGARPLNYDAEKIKAEKAIKQSEEKAKKKEEKKRAWAIAKKRYKDDVAAKKAILKKARKEKKKAKLAAMSGKQKAGRILLKLLLIVLILALIGGGVYLGIKRLGIFFDDNKKGDDTSIPETVTTETDDANETDDPAGSIGQGNPPSGDKPEDYEMSRPDADEFFKENSEIISEVDASTAGRTEAEAYKNLTDRGFTVMPITVKYAMTGAYSDPVEISSSGTEKHPIYTTYYITEDGSVWSIFEINGAVFANPVSYNLEYEKDVQVMFSETETITSYDSTRNKFYVTKPNETALDVRIVEKIDANTLETLTAREIDKQ